MIPLLRLGNEKWDQSLVLDALCASPHDIVESTATDGGAVILVPVGGHEGDVGVAELQALIDPMPWVVILCTADEAGLFPWKALQHPNMRLWLQTPGPETHAGHDRFLLVGYPPNTPQYLDEIGWKERTFDWAFAGQVNHERREQLFKRLRMRKTYAQDFGYLDRTDGFTQGIPRDDFLEMLAATKVALCPSGPATPDTFRFVEALEAGCVPIVDSECPLGKNGYWPLVLGHHHPIPIVEGWKNVDDVIDYQLSNWPANATRISAWWQNFKRDMYWWITKDITEVSGQEPLADFTTVLVPTSPIPSHPSTVILEQTLASVRHWLPTAEVIIMCDGVRPEQEHHRDRYEEYLNRVVWNCEHVWENTLPVVFDEHTHQAAMTRSVLEKVETPTILFVEHDTPLVTDCEIPWHEIFELVCCGDLNLVRFAHEAAILDEHKRLMVEHDPVNRAGVWTQATLQWSQRPHVARTSYYRKLLTHPRLQGRTMIEDAAHSITQTEPWGAHRLAIFTPPGDNIKRSWHTDGRDGDEKWGSS